MDNIKMKNLDFTKSGGLLPVVAQDYKTNEVLMLAYINEAAFKETVSSGNAVYFSRSRNELWRKGATSGHVQLIREILVDCDNDAVIYKVEQLGAGACHTGHRSCFYRRLGEDGVFTEFEEVKFDPEKVYGKK